MIRAAQLLLEEQREQVFEVPKEKKNHVCTILPSDAKFAVRANVQLKTGMVEDQSLGDSHPVAIDSCEPV